eukprot:TRINITY_DN3114_c0_g1_i8.p1 TRINITY_DN3114_c0_g1~~TRINITY_DN3114_c0_g1_i8.p1  ORF type:complete len:405 (+),score=124.39 TRINITY_DN3114_c0_g1_i8:2495-3709(+)
MAAEALANHVTILESFKQLHCYEFKALLSYIIDAANTLTTGRRLTGFQLSSLSQLMEVKSPQDKSITVLHSLIGLIEEKSPEVVNFVKANHTLFGNSVKAMANFQSYFPKIIQKLWQIEAEYHKCPESEFKRKLEEFRNQLIEESTNMNKKLAEIDEEIVFFGNNENQLAPDSTINDIKRLWVDLRDLGIFAGAECLKRAKRDEDRYTFFVTVDTFFRDVNKARSFLEAKKTKAKQKEEFEKEIEGKKDKTPTTARKESHGKTHERKHSDKKDGEKKDTHGKHHADRKDSHGKPHSEKKDPLARPHLERKDSGKMLTPRGSHPKPEVHTPRGPHSKTDRTGSPARKERNNSTGKEEVVEVRRKKSRKEDSEDEKKTKNFSFESFEEMQANVQKRRVVVQSPAYK